MARRTLWLSLIGGAALGLAGWMTPPSAAAPVLQRRVPATATPPADVAPLQLANLTRYTRVATSPRLPGRDPFSFDRPPSVPPAPTTRGQEARWRVAVTVLPPPATDPLPVLAGIAEQQETGSVVRTGVLTEGDGGVRFVLEGQRVGRVYRVAEVGPDRVVLVHTGTGQTSELLLK